MTTTRPSAARTPRRVRSAIAAGVLAVVLAAAPAVPVGAATTATTTPAPLGTAPAPVGTPDIIPLPNSGRAPATPGDRGGWQQQVLFFSICGAILVGIGLMWRESRVKRRRQGRLPVRSTKNGG